MSGNFSFETSLRTRRESMIPLRTPAENIHSSKIRNSATPKVAAASIPVMAGVANLNIQPVDPAKLTAPASLATRMEKILRLPKSRAARLAVAGLAAAAFTLVPAVALASTSFVAFYAGLSLPGKMIFAFGVYSAVKYVWRAWQKNKPENYRSKKMDLVTDNPTPRKLWKTLIQPLWALSFAAGSALSLFPGLESLIGLRTFDLSFLAENTRIGSGSLVLYGLLASVPLIRMFSSAIKDTYTHIFKFKKKHIQDNQHPQTWTAKFVTDILAPLGWLSTVTFMGMVNQIFGAHTLRLSLNFATNFAALFSSPGNILGMGPLALTLGIAFALYRGLISWPKQKIGTYADKMPSRMTSSLRWALGGVVLGSVLNLFFPAMAINNLLVFAVNLFFAHNLLHSTRSQEGGFFQARKKLMMYDLQSLWEAVRSAAGAIRTVFKPSIEMVDPYISAYVMMLISEGANWVCSGVCGAFGTGPYVEGQQMVEKLIKKDMRIIQKIYKDGNEAVKAARDNKAAVEAAAAAFDKVASLYTDPIPENEGHPLALGNLRSRSGLSFLKNTVYAAGLPEAGKGFIARSDLAFLKEKKDAAWDALVRAGWIDGTGKVSVSDSFDIKNLDFTPVCAGADLTGYAQKCIVKVFERAEKEAARSDQDCRRFTEDIRWAALFLRRRADSIRHREKFEEEDLESLQKDLTEDLDAAFRRCSVLIDTHPGRFWTNILWDSYNAKQFIVDEFQQIMADFVGGMEIPVMTPNGRIHNWLVPMKVVKDFKEDYASVLAIESSNLELEDLRLEWYERDPLDIGNSLCDIAYLDNTAHFRKYKEKGGIEFLTAYPTAEVPTAPVLKKEATFDPYQEIWEPQEFYDLVYKNGARLRVFADGTSRLVRGDPDSITVPALMVPGTERHIFVAEKIRRNEAHDVFRYDIYRDPELAAILATGQVPHPFGGGKNFTDSPYLAPRWHFMYPTEYTSVSDADQMDKIVANLRLHHTRKNPHLRVMMMRPRKEELPFSPDMLDNPKDSFLEVGVAVSWMMLKVKFKPDARGKQRELFIPLNRNKENERTFGGELWRYIDEERKVEMVEENGRHFLKIPYRREALKDPDFPVEESIIFNNKYNNRESIEKVPVPVEMEELIGDIEQISINPGRYGEVGGPRPVADYFFVRRDENGYVTSLSSRQPGATKKLRLTDRLADILIFGKTALLSRSEVAHWELVKKEEDESPRENLPWTDEDGWVHVKMSEDEVTMLEGWMPKFHGLEQPTYDEAAKELKIYVKHFDLLCEDAFSEFTYRRFMPDYKFRTYFDPAEVSLGHQMPAGLAHELIFGDLRPGSDGRVHIPMSEYGYVTAQRWLPKYRGTVPTEYVNGELVMSPEHFGLLRQQAHAEQEIERPEDAKKRPFSSRTLNHVAKKLKQRKARMVRQEIEKRMVEEPRIK